MVYKKITNPIQKFGQKNPFGPEQAGSVGSQDIYTFEASVVDVITNESHEKYATQKDSDMYDVGCVQFKSRQDVYRKEETLNWAFPMDAGMEDFPLKGEVVWITWLMNRFYYIRAINLGNNPPHQSYPELKEEITTSPISGKEIQNLNQSTYSPINVTENKNSLGNYFVDNSKIFRLKNWEGDRIYFGRMGQSIRFGSAWKDENKYNIGTFKSLEENQAPNIIIRVGQNPKALPIPNSLYGRVVEDINNDKTSIWMVTNQIVDLKPSTSVDDLIHLRSIPDYPSIFSGNQLIMNSDRIILNSKSDKIIFHSAKGYHVTTLMDSTLDVQRDHVGIIGRDKAFEILGNKVENVGYDNIMWVGFNTIVNSRVNTNFSTGYSFNVLAGYNVSLVSPKIYIGAQSNAGMQNSEHMVLGDTLVEILTQIINAIIQPPVHTWSAVGPGFLDSRVRNELIQVRNKLNDILSESNYLKKINEVPPSIAARVPIHPR